MHDTFIKMAQELEENILNDKIKIKTKEDWNKLKGIVWNLGELYKEEEEKSQNIIETEEKTITIENCQNFAKMVWKYMKQMEIEHKMDLNECLENVMFHLRFLVLYNRLGAYRRELMEQYELETKENNEISFIEVEDVFDKKYPKKRIKKCDYSTFNEAYKQQKDLHKQGKISLIDSYNQEVVEFQNEIIAGKIKAGNVKQWNIIKRSIHKFLNLYHIAFADLERINHFSYRIDRSPFLVFILECIEKIENKYNGMVPEAEIASMFEFIRVLCHHYVLNDKLKDIGKEIKNAPRFSGDKMEEGKVLAKNNGILVCINKETEEQYEYLTSEVDRISPLYKEAQEFIFGMNLYELEENKRAM